ncbi:hypothetical protein [Prosthecomicrobium hirschii]|nr:hypothetical protein [Prosthecomicrobium hirschii]
MALVFTRRGAPKSFDKNIPELPAAKLSSDVSSWWEHAIWIARLKLYS